MEKDSEGVEGDEEGRGMTNTGSRKFHRLGVPNEVCMYDSDEHVAELYDQQESNTNDVQLIKGLIGNARERRFLEPFCGTGKILIPLVRMGIRRWGWIWQKRCLT